MKIVMSRLMTPLSVAATLLIGFNISLVAAELPQSSKEMLKALKIDEKILTESPSEYVVPKAWIDGAKKEGRLKIIGTWDPAHHRVYMRSFEARFPDVKYDYTRAGRQNRTVKPLFAFKEGRYISDVISGLGNAFFAYRDAKALMPIGDLPNAKLLNKEMRDPGGLWLGHQAGYWCVSYNTNLVKKEELPKTWDGFLDASKWGKGRIGMGNRANLWFLQLWKANGAQWGLNYMNKLFNEVKPQQRKEGLNALTSLVIAGEYGVALPGAMYRAAQFVKKVAPVGWHCPEPVPATVQFIVALRGNPHPNKARIYIYWMLSKEGQIAQYYAVNAPSILDELQIPQLIAFPDEVRGRKKAFRDPQLLHEAWPRVLANWRAAWDKSAGGSVKTVSTKLTKIIRGGRSLEFKAGKETHQVKISGSRTAVRIGGKKAARGALKAGMACTIVYPEHKGEAREVICN